MCRKFHYTTREAAEDAVRHTNRNPDNPLVLTGVYECDACGGFHTTSKGKDLEACNQKEGRYAEIQYWKKKIIPKESGRRKVSRGKPKNYFRK